MPSLIVVIVFRTMYTYCTRRPIVHIAQCVQETDIGEEVVEKQLVLDRGQL